MDSSAGAYCSIKSKSEAILGHERPGQLLFDIAGNAVQQLVVVLGVVVEYGEPLRAGGAAQAHALLPGRMSPADIGVVLGVGVHAVVDHQVGAGDQLEDAAVGR